jgi:hypothetical protein
VLDGIDRAANMLTAGSMFVFYYGGHGGQMPDRDGDEPSGQDQYLCTYDGAVCDDELGPRWLNFQAGVNLLIITDSCHSGSVVRNIKKANTVPLSIGLKAMVPKKRGTRGGTGNIPGLKADLIHFAGCLDQQRAWGSNDSGYLTSGLLQAWQENRNGSYNAWFDRAQQLARDAAARSAGQAQDPQMTTYGPNKDSIGGQAPFTVGAGYESKFDFKYEKKFNFRGKKKAAASKASAKTARGTKAVAKVARGKKKPVKKSPAIKKATTVKVAKKSAKKAGKRKAAKKQ